jgi:protease I
MPKKILHLVGDFVETLEAYVPFQALTMLGHTVHIACPGKMPGETCVTAVHDFEGQQTYTEKRGHNIHVNTDFGAIDPAAYDALYLPGGRAPEYLRLNDRVLTMIRHFFECAPPAGASWKRGKPVGAICHAVQLLTAAGVCEGRHMSCYPACRPELERAGGRYAAHNETYSNAVVDANLVSGPAWPAHAELLRQFAQLLGTRIQG